MVRIISARKATSKEVRFYEEGPLKPTNTTEAIGDYTKARIDLRLEKRHSIERPILVMDLSEASKRLGTRIDGFVGQDILREFAAERIDCKAQTVEFGAIGFSA